MSDLRIQLLEDLGAEFARIEAAHQQGESRRTGMRTGTLWAARGRGALVALSLLVAVVASLYAVPATRATLETLADSFDEWVLGDDENAPGRALRPDDDAPAWVRESGDPTRLIAEAAGVGLYATRSTTPNGDAVLQFSLGKDSAIVGASVDEWRRRFDEHAVVVLGPAPTRSGDELDERGRFPLQGVTAQSVDSVELRYATGPSLVADDLDGGFVLLADSRRELREIVAYDESGRELERTDVDVQAPVVP